LGVLLRNQLWLQVLCLELMLNALHWTWVTLYRYKVLPEGDAWLLVLYVLTAIELTVGFAVLFMVFKHEINDSCKR
jgi:NADH:ubiquinone oxidoreductase subunit K